jgi:hypothetical protein
METNKQLRRGATDERTRKLDNQLRKARANNEPSRITTGLFLKLIYSDLHHRPTEWPDSYGFNRGIGKEDGWVSWDDWAATWVSNDILDESSTALFISLIKRSILADAVADAVKDLYRKS